MFTQDGAKLVGGESIVKRIVANPSGSESQEIFVGATLCGGPPERADTGVCPYTEFEERADTEVCPYTLTMTTPFGSR